MEDKNQWKIVPRHHTLDTFVNSSWYFLRFCSPENSEYGFSDDGNKILDAS